MTNLLKMIAMSKKTTTKLGVNFNRRDLIIFIRRKVSISTRAGGRFDPEYPLYDRSRFLWKLNIYCKYIALTCKCNKKFK